MVTRSLTRQITEILFESNSETARIWGSNAVGKPCGLLVKCGDGGSPSARIRSEDEEAMMVPARSEDVERVTVPDPERFVLLPDRVGNEEPEALGVMMCDVYEFRSGALVPKPSGKAFRDPSELERGVTGPGIEFLYGDSLENGEQTQWNLSLPRFRDCFTPKISAGTVRALFRYGRTDDRFKNPRNVPTGEESELPRLRSAV